MRHFLTIWLARSFQLKIGTPLTSAQGKVYTNFDFSVFELRARAGQMDGQET